MIATVFKTTTRLLCTTLLSVIVVCAQSQVADRTEGDTSQSHASPVKTDIGAPSLPYQTGTQNIVVGKENVSVFTTGLGPTPVENMISQLESQECTAILKQDTAVLRRLWGRDFTLNDPLNEVVTGKTSLPYYVYFRRLVEKVNPIDDNLVFTSGSEFLQRIKPDGSLAEPVTRTYFHAWTRGNGVWKLSTKTHGEKTD